MFLFECSSDKKTGYSIFILLLFLLVWWPLTATAVTPIPAPPYSQTQLQSYMTKGWTGFKSNFITSSGRVMRPENSSDTVSEGQAYALLLAVYFNDKKTFDKCLAWTEQNLSRTLAGSSSYGGPDNLLAWHWEVQGGVQGNNWDAASDADGDYAQALLLAYEMWGQQSYLTKALKVLNDILAKETYQPTNFSSGDVLFLKPGNWGEGNIFGNQGTFINPSYLSPAWYRHFNDYLPDSRWQKLIDGSYYILNNASAAIFDPVTHSPSTGIGLLPDWAFIDDSGTIFFTDDSANNPGTTVSSWDAFRAPWRVYTDLKMTHNNETRAQTYLNQLAAFYQDEFNAGRRIYASYYYSGAPTVNYTNPASSGVPLLCANLNPLQSLSGQSGAVQIALAYILKSSPTNPPLNNQFSGPDTFQDLNKSTGYFIAPGDILRYYINSWCLFGLITP